MLNTFNIKLIFVFYFAQGNNLAHILVQAFNKKKYLEANCKLKK